MKPNENNFKKIYTDLIRMKANNEKFLRGFLNFTLSQKTPFPGSWLGFDFDSLQYKFWRPKAMSCLSQFQFRHFLYYPFEQNAIYMTKNTEWISQESQRILRGEKELAEVVYTTSGLLHDFIQNEILHEIKALKEFCIKPIIEDSSSKIKSLF